MGNYYKLDFATNYSTGAYGACTYNDSSTTSTCAATSGGTSGSSGGLVDTGFVVLVIVTVACALLFAALIVRFWRPPRKLATAPARANQRSDDE